MFFENGLAQCQKLNSRASDFLTNLVFGTSGFQTFTLLVFQRVIKTKYIFLEAKTYECLKITDHVLCKMIDLYQWVLNLKLIINSPEIYLSSAVGLDRSSIPNSLRSHWLGLLLSLARSKGFIEYYTKG